MTAPAAGRLRPKGTLVRHLGRAALAVAGVAGGMALVAGRVAIRIVPPRFEWSEFVRSAHRFGVMSLPLISVTAFLTGVIGMLQSAPYVETYGATMLVGWGTGFTTLREIGPILIALMISGRVGSKNTAELATMVVTEQVDALRALAIDPYAFLVVPRVLALVVVTFALTVLGDFVAIAGGAASARALAGVSVNAFWTSFQWVPLGDFTHGLLKSVVFGAAIAVVSAFYGLAVRGGAAGVGRAVNESVVASAVAIFVIDYLLTYVLT